MLRIARVKKSAFLQPGSDEEKIFSEHNDLTKLIKRHLSPVTASIFAIPTILENSDEIEWSSELKGQPVKLTSLPEEEQQQAKKLLNDRLSAITRLADELPQQAPETEKLQPILKQALHYPSDDAVYVINGQPVITFWGIGDKSKSAKIPGAATIIPPVAEVQKTRKFARFIKLISWLLLLALLAFILWYWFSKNPVNWRDYNPFVDEYQQLVDEVNGAGDDCLALDKIYQNNVLLQRPEEKYGLIKQQVEAKLASCEAYMQLVKLIEQAKDDCQKLKQILENNTYLQKPEGLFIELGQRLENDIQLCEYNNLKAKIQSASGNCPELKNILDNNQYLQNPQGNFVELRQQLENSINLCAEYQTLKTRIDAAKDDCELLKTISKENQYLQQAEGMFVELKQKTAELIKKCEDYQTLADEIKQAGKDCKKLKQLAKENDDYLQNAEGKFADLKRQLDKQKMPCERKKIENLVNLCPGERPKKLAPELVVVFDASGSMKDFVEIPPKLRSLARKIKTARNPLEAGLLMLTWNAEAAKYGPENSRMYAAKKAVSSLVPKIPSDMNTGLVVLKQCSSAQKYRFYAPNERKQFLGEINRLIPTQGTPLGSGLSIAGQMVDGVKKPATIIVISDGEESCNANPCAIARRLAKSKPYLTINVVDILGTGAGNCLARATKKGKVYTARNMRDIINMTEQAASSAIPKHCKK